MIALANVKLLKKRNEKKLLHYIQPYDILFKSPLKHSADTGNTRDNEISLIFEN